MTTTYTGGSGGSSSLKPMATKGAKRKAASKARAQFSSDPKYESHLTITGIYD